MAVTAAILPDNGYKLSHYIVTNARGCLIKVYVCVRAYAYIYIGIGRWTDEWAEG
jgi:hypothetical protein